MYVIYCLILLPDNDWWALLVFLCKMNPIKAHWGKSSWPFSFERLATVPPQADHVLVDLLSSVVARGRGGGVCGWSPPTGNFLALLVKAKLGVVAAILQPWRSQIWSLMSVNCCTDASAYLPPAHCKWENQVIRTASTILADKTCPEYYKPWETRSQKHLEITRLLTNGNRKDCGRDGSCSRCLLCVELGSNIPVTLRSPKCLILRWALPATTP